MRTLKSLSEEWLDLMYWNMNHMDTLTPLSANLLFNLTTLQSYFEGESRIYRELIQNKYNL